MYIISCIASNNDTYQNKEFFCSRCTNTPEEKENLNPEELTYESVFKELPTQKEIIKLVKGCYDGVWVPDLDTIRVYKIEEIKMEWESKD
jgi:hypothetical protein